MFKSFKRKWRAARLEINQREYEKASALVRDYTCDVLKMAEADLRCAIFHLDRVRSWQADVIDEPDHVDLHDLDRLIKKSFDDYRNQI